MKVTPLVLILFISVSCQAQIIDKEGQIAAAIQAAPDGSGAQAKVYGFDETGALVILKEGTNQMVCIADDPTKEGFSVACYHSSLEPFMARGRALKREGKNPGEIFEIREKEAKSGQLRMPEAPATLHVLSGPKGRYNSETQEVENANLRYVVYIPFATAESTGLPLKPAMAGGPWIMDPGTHRAHIMVTPPVND